MTIFSDQLQTHWQNISPLLTIRNEREYDAAVERMNELLDTLGTLIQAYEEEHHSIPKAKGADVLRFLIDEHRLTQSELPEVGSQGVVSEILNGKRELNLRQIRALGKCFKVSASAFV